MLGRCLQVSSGLLWSRGQNFGKWKQRWFELTATHLVYFTSNLYREAANGSLPSGGAPPRKLPQYRCRLGCILVIWVAFSSRCQRYCC